MNKNERSWIKGNILIQLFDEKGQLLKQDRIANLITEYMDAHVADQMSDQGQSGIGYIAVGTGNGQTASDTGLDVSLSRIALDSKTQGAGADDNDVVYIGTWGPGVGTGALTEAGIMQADNNTSLCCYVDFSAYNKGATHTLVITWTVTYGAS